MTLGQDYALKISPYAVDSNPNTPTQFSWSRTHLVGIAVSLLQLAVTAVPYVLGHGLGVLLVTLGGALLVQCCGNLPQWTVEKLPVQQKSESIYALTRGRDSSHIIVIVGNGYCLDLECLAGPPDPRDPRSWESFGSLSSI